jgi:HEAT repeat protein
VRYTATTVMASLARDAGERAAVVEAATTDPNVGTRRWAATLFCALAVDAGGLPDLAAMNSTIREAALHARVRSGFDEAAMLVVRNATDDPDPDVRREAYEIVSARRNSFPDVLSLVTKASRDHDAEIRLWVWPRYWRRGRSRTTRATRVIAELPTRGRRSAGLRSSR